MRDRDALESAEAALVRAGQSTRGMRRATFTLPDPPVLTAEFAEEMIERHGACPWIRDYVGRDFATIVRAQPYGALQLCPDLLSDAQFDRAARKAPFGALQFATDRLSDEQFARAILDAPIAALAWAAHRMTPETFCEVVARTRSATTQTIARAALVMEESQCA